jgi:hypothetical protein
LRPVDVVACNTIFVAITDKLCKKNLSSWNIKRQGVKFYTREVFSRFQKKLSATTRFYPLRAEVEGLSFDLVPNLRLDLKTYRVQVVLDDGVYLCGCNQF